VSPGSTRIRGLLVLGGLIAAVVVALPAGHSRPAQTPYPV
jgi:hypothetical protein